MKKLAWKVTGKRETGKDMVRENLTHKKAMEVVEEMVMNGFSHIFIKKVKNDSKRKTGGVRILQLSK